MSIVTVVATPEPANVPPRIRLNVTDTGTSPAITATTVTRLNPDGSLVPVRTQDGNPLQLTTSGANRVGLLYDYEVPLGQAVSFSTVETPASSSTQVTLSDSRIWLVHPGVPALSMPVELRAGSFDEETYPVSQGVFRVMGRETPVVVSDGSRGAASSSMTVAADTPNDVRAIKELVRDASVLFLNVPPSLGLLIDSCYIAVSEVRHKRLSDIGSAPQRNVTLPYLVVDRPVGGSQAQRTLLDLLSYPTLNSLQAAYPTLNAVLAGP